MHMGRYVPVARFGLMHMIATNLCEWLYVLVEETKHEIEHLSHHGEYTEAPRIFNHAHAELLKKINAMDGACGAHGGGEGCIQHFGWEA
jgi:hypothetical protein